MEDPAALPGLIPHQYTKSRFWRFLLDTKAEATRPDEPRFKQFAENLRNYAVAGVMFRAAQMMAVGMHHPFLSVGRFLLIALACATTALCLAQQFALLIVSFHWYVGWNTWDHMALSRDKQRRENFKRAGIDDGRRRASVKFWAAILVPAFFLWAMLSFIFSPAR